MSSKITHTIGIILNGVTGRMGLNQHLRRSLDAIRADGGVALNETEFIMPNLLLVGRNPVKLEAISQEFGNAQMVHRSGRRTGRPEFLHLLRRPDHSPRRSREEGHRGRQTRLLREADRDHLAGALDLYELAKKAGVKHGVVQDKLWLPGLRQAADALSTWASFGEILSVRGEFGYWVFEGDTVPAQRPSWNYRKEDGGGIILDMLCHWRYVLDNLFGESIGLVPRRDPHQQRRDEAGKPYHLYRRRLLLCHIPVAARHCGALQLFLGRARAARRSAHPAGRWDEGTAVAGLRDCWIQPRSNPAPHLEPGCRQSR